MRPFLKGDLVQYTSSFLRNVGWVTGVPINGRVIATKTLGRNRIVRVLWCDRDEAIGVLERNLELHRANARRSLYQRMLDVDAEIGNWHSDLHVKVTDVTREVLHRYTRERENPPHVEYFRSNLDGATWMEIAFAYEPAWGHR